MQPKHRAETSGPFFPSGRSRITVSITVSLSADHWLDENFLASDTLAPRKFATMKRYNEVVVDQASAVKGKEPEHNRVGEQAQASSRGQHIFSIGLSLAASVISGAIFLISLVDQLALVEIAASLGTALQVFFFSSALADLIERGKASRGRNAWAIVFAVLLIAKTIAHAFRSFSRSC